MSKSVFDEVQAALLNSDCDPFEAGVDGLCALYSFVATELEGSTLSEALADVLVKLRIHGRLPPEYQEELRTRLRHDRYTIRPRKS